MKNPATSSTSGTRTIHLRHWREATAAVLATAGIAVGVLVGTGHSGPSSKATIGSVGYSTATPSGQLIANLAYSHLHEHLGNTTGNNPTGNPPSWDEWWCADFAAYIWGKAGADTTGLNPLAASFEYKYGHESFSSTPHVGDAMVVGSSPTQDGQLYGNVTHVAIVVAVDQVKGKVTTVGGDEGTGHWEENSVQSQITRSAPGSDFGPGYLGTTPVETYVYGYSAPYFPQPLHNLTLRVADGSLSGHYVSVGAGTHGSGAVARAGNAATSGSQNNFDFVPARDQSGAVIPGAYYLKSQATGGYLSARFNLTGNQRGTLYAVVGTPGAWETFHEQHVGSNAAFYIYDGSSPNANTGTRWYVSTEMNSGGVLRARTTSAAFNQNVGGGSWELFSVGS